MPRSSSLSPDNILRFLQVRQHSVSTAELAGGLNLPENERKALFKTLSKLKKRGLIVEVAAGKYRLKAKKAAVVEEERAQDPEPKPGGSGLRGRLVLHQDGYGFVIPDEPIRNMAGDIFIPRHATEDAM